MRTELNNLDRKEKISNNINFPFTDHEKTQINDVVSNLLINPPRVKKCRSIGGNAGATVLLGGGAGGSCGYTKSTLGQRNVVLFGQVYLEGGLLVGPSIKAGCYSKEINGRSVVYTDMFAVSASFFGPSGSLFECDDESVCGAEGGLGGLGVGIKWMFTVGREICSLPTDWKRQREKLELTMKMDRFPAWLEEVEDIDELQRYYLEYLGEYKRLAKQYSKEKYSEEKKEDVKLELEEEERIEAS